MSENPQDLVGQQVGNYHLIDWLGRGGFADVYLGEHIHLKTQGAVKMLHIDLSHKALKDFFNEARTIARLQHPNVIQMLDYGVEHGNPFLVVTYAPNGSLREHFLPGKRIAPEQVIPIVQQVASALDYAHRKRLIHRDVKPANMLFGTENQVLLSDFGLAVVAQSTNAQVAREVGGTVYYMAPEQLQGKARFASDQYALGIATYEWLCGERPFDGNLTEIASQHMISPPPSLRDKVPRLPAAVERVVFKALAKKPNQRYESATAFADALQEAFKDPKLTATHIFAVQLSLPLAKTPPSPAEKLTSPASTKPKPRRLYPSHSIKPITLVLVATLIMIIGMMGLWYGFAYSQALTQQFTFAAEHYNSPPASNASATASPDPIGSAGTSRNILATAAKPTPVPPSSSLSELDCLTGTPSQLTFFTQSNSFPFPTQTVTLTNCGGTATTWSYSEQTDDETQLDVTAASKSLAAHQSEQVQIALISKGTGTHHGSITFTKGSARWTVSVTYTIK